MTNNVAADPNDQDEHDSVIMVQLGAELVSKARMQFQTLQESLDKETPNQGWRAHQLRQRIKDHYTGLEDSIHNEVLELGAMLLTYENEKTPTAEDCQCEIFGRQIHRTLMTMDGAAGLTTRTSSSCATSSGPSETAIDLDTPPGASDVLDERGLHDLRLQDEQALQEEDGLIKVIEECEAERAAKKAQEADDEALQAAMNAPKVKKQKTSDEHHGQHWG